MSILVTGGAGYIGSHTCVELLNAGHDIALLDNFSNAKHSVVDRIRELAGKSFPVYETDILDEAGLRRVFAKERISAVVHFAGLKAVGESVSMPLSYYHNNVSGSVNLLRVMEEAGCRRMVFSSSATVYGENNTAPFKEDAPLSATNPYGMTKLIIERILQDAAASGGADVAQSPPQAQQPSQAQSPPQAQQPSQAQQSQPPPQQSQPPPPQQQQQQQQQAQQVQQVQAQQGSRWSVALLRYFNPVGAHPSGLLGEDPNGIPNNLVPYIAKVAAGKLDHLNVYGDDYDTRDGTGVRDYLHVVDLALGHIKALEYIEAHSGAHAVNLGTGTGYSVMEVLRAFERACGKPIAYKIAARRPGDIAEGYADASKALALLGWKAERGLDEMCADMWNFAAKHYQ